jgi:nitrite reductase/ring-hydroxylating ferredoxin subunit
MKPVESNQPAAVEGERRSFLVRLAAVVCGGIVALFPFAAGWGVIIDPWRRRRAASAADGEPLGATATGPNFVRICSLDALTPGGDPQPFAVILKVVDDAWTRTFNQKVGVIFLERSNAGNEPSVVALNAKCPHLGCLVDFNRTKAEFQCPCHESAFAKDGERLYGPSLRGMDPLAVEVRSTTGQQEVFVAFQKFMPGIAERTPAG